MLNEEQREQLQLIERCDPSWLLSYVKQNTHFDAAVLERVFELAKEQANSLLAASAAPAEGRHGYVKGVEAAALTITEEPRDGNWYEFNVNGHGGVIRVVARMDGEDDDLPLGNQIRAFLLSGSALIDERDAAVIRAHMQAFCIQQCAAHIGPDTATTLYGLPKAVKRIVQERDEARAALATEPTMSEAVLKQFRWVTEKGPYSNWQDTTDDEIETLRRQRDAYSGGFYEVRTLVVSTVDRIDRAAAKGKAMSSSNREPKQGWRVWGSDRCDHCCNGDRCDDPTHLERQYCPYCLGTGDALWLRQRGEAMSRDIVIYKGSRQFVVDVIKDLEKRLDALEGDDGEKGEAVINEREAWAHERIWLQREAGEGGSHTWCEDSIDDCEQAEYVRVDVASRQSADDEFKNFHRLLCERFGYSHDEKHWKRDQLSLIEWIAARQSAGATGQEAIYQVSMQPNGPWQDISKATYDILVESDACPDVRIVYAALIGDNGAAHVRMATRTASGPELHAALAESQPSESKRVELTPTDIRAIANSYDLDNAPLIVEFSRALLARVSAKGE